MPLTDVAYGCYRSSNNYPHLVAAALHIEDLQRPVVQRRPDQGPAGRQITARGLSRCRRSSTRSPQRDRPGHHRASARTTTASTPGWRRSCRKSRSDLPAPRPARDAAAGSSTSSQPALVSSLEEIRDRAPGRAGAAGRATPSCSHPSATARGCRGCGPRTGHLPRHQPAAAQRDGGGRRRRPRWSSWTSTHASVRPRRLLADPWIQGRIGNGRARRRAAPAPRRAGRAGSDDHREAAHPAAEGLSQRRSRASRRATTSARSASTSAEVARHAALDLLDVLDPLHQPGRERRRHHADHPDAADHQPARDEPALGRGGVHVAVPHGGDRRQRPPERVAEALDRPVPPRSASRIASAPISTITVTEPAR